MPQEDLTADTLVQALEKLAQDAPKLREALAGEPASDGTEAVLGLIREISR